MNRKTMTFGSGENTTPNEEGQDAHHSDPIPNEDQQSHLPSLDEGPQRLLIGRIKTHQFALLALQLLNDTVLFGTLVLIVLGLNTLIGKLS